MDLRRIIAQNEERIESLKSYQRGTSVSVTIDGKPIALSTKVSAQVVDLAIGAYVNENIDLSSRLDEEE